MPRLPGAGACKLALETFALSIEAIRAPLEHYDEALESLWGDRDEAAILRALRGYLGSGQRRSYQAPVSFRIVPRILGHAHRAVRAAEHAASVSLSSISDNPVYLAPDASHPFGRCISTGGYHNAMAAPALDDLAGIWADLCLLCERHAAKLLNGRVSHLPDQLLVGRKLGQSDGRGNIGYVTMAANGYIELAKSAAQRTFIPGNDSGAGQDDVATPAFLAWSKEARAGRCLDASLAMLAVVASQALFVTDREAPTALRGFMELIRNHVAPVIEDRILGPELGQLADAITANVFGTEEHRLQERVSHLDRIRRHGTAVENAVIDEYRAGRLDRRAFLRYAAVLGMTAPLLGALAPARARAAVQPGRRGDGWDAGAGGPDRSAHRGRHRQHLPAVPDRGISRGLRPRTSTAAGARAELAAERGWQRLDVQDSPRRQVPRRAHADRSRCGGDHGPARRSEERLHRLVGLRRHALERRRDGAKRRHRAV